MNHSTNQDQEDWALSYELLATRFDMPRTASGLFRGGSAGQVVYNALRDKIVRLELEPGQALVRSELVDEFGFSLTPVRDALQQLAEEGLVEIYPQSRTLVTRIDEDAIQEAHFMRVAVETEVVRELATSIRDKDLARLRQIFEFHAEVIEKAGQIPLIQEVDELFHQALFIAADKFPIQRLLRSRAGDLERLRRIHIDNSVARNAGVIRNEAVIREHRAILEGIESGRSAETVEIMREHLDHTMRLIEDKRAAYPELFREA